MSALFSCNDLPAHEQFDAWRETVSNAFVPLDAKFHTAGPFHGELLTEAVGSLQVSEVSGGAVEVCRTPDAIRRSDPGYLKLGMQIRGYCVLTQDDREAALTPGDFSIYDTRRPYQVCFERDFAQLVVMFPHELIHLRPDALDEMTARRVSGRRGIGGLVSKFLVGMAEQLRGVEELTANQHLSNGVLNLLAAALSEQLGCESNVPPETHRAALILQIKAFVDARLYDPELSSHLIARAHNISPRYLQKMFEGEGTTVTEWIRRRRLENCRRDLVDPRLSTTPIATIAAQWGLLDSSYFSKLFKTTYGMSPREFRSQAERPVIDAAGTPAQNYSDAD
ncbi:helix-turn-helix domain-containing protein [Rhodococcus sp. JS3073]|uniref:AraC-like ligand-binding domain-containing protein n=1 Tax=Rhodococcus sp. JS3073 TaxID=3002901 RepID=UPI0022857828|nr:helix-turn-helix domain-containing protein [Rhodococcus sp. JS3073]WAM19274.1 helix-turn-helix domain-containing protein [Rhodococcus sp. JS3073]